MQGVEVRKDIYEEMKALFLNEDYLVEAPQKIYRYNDNIGGRRYFSLGDGNYPIFYNSVTTHIGATVPKGEWLEKWMSQMGYEKALEYRDQRARFGTFLHILIEHYAIGKSIDFAELPLFIKDHQESIGVDENREGWLHEARKSILSYAQFAADVNLAPVAVEIVLASEELGLAGAVDMVAWMDIEENDYFGEVYKSGPQKGKPKKSKRKRRALCILDWKSSLKGFYESSEFQILIYRKMWEDAFPEYPIEYAFCWRPTDWKDDIPGYKLKDQTLAKTEAEILSMVDFGHYRIKRIPRPKLHIEGTMTFGENPKDNVSIKTAEQLIVDVFAEKGGRIMSRIKRSPEEQTTHVLPVIGKISIGEKTMNQSGEEHARSLDYFRPSERYAPDFTSVYGEKPGSIKVLFPSDNIDQVCHERFEFREFKTGRLLADGDGEKFRFWTPGIREPVEMDSPGVKKATQNKGKWRTVLTLRFFLPDLGRVMGCWQLTTCAQKSSIPAIVSTFDHVQSLASSVLKIPFDLNVNMASSQRPGDYSRYPVLQLIPNLSQERLEQVQELGLDLMQVKGLLTDEKVGQLVQQTQGPGQAKAIEAQAEYMPPKDKPNAQGSLFAAG